MTEETKSTCPYCQSSLTVRLGNETHCNSCGKSWGLDKNPISTIALDRKARQSDSTGFHRHHHASEGLADLEKALNESEATLREASRRVLGCKGDSAERLRLRQDEHDARQKRDRLLQIRGELVSSRVSS
jgi:hypothetical protein